MGQLPSWVEGNPQAVLSAWGALAKSSLRRCRGDRRVARSLRTTVARTAKLARWGGLDGGAPKVSIDDDLSRISGEAINPVQTPRRFSVP